MTPTSCRALASYYVDLVRRSTSQAAVISRVVEVWFASIVFPPLRMQYLEDDERRTSVHSSLQTDHEQALFS